MRTTVRAISFAAVLGLAVAAVAATGARLEQYPQSSANGTAAPMYLPQAKYLRPLSLGYANVLANVLWFQAINYFGMHYRTDRLYPWLGHICDLVTDLDPRAEHVYRFAGVTLPWEAGEADAGIQLLKKGLRAFPDSWLLHYWLGFNYYFFKSDFANAATHFHRAAQLPEAHPNAARLAALLYAEQYGPDTALAFLREMARHTDDAQMRDVVQRHLLEARLAVDLDQLREAVAAYRERFGRNPATVDTLVSAKLLATVPREPFGGTYRVDRRSGRVSSSTGVVPSRLHESPLRARILRGDSVRDH